MQSNPNFTVDQHSLARAAEAMRCLPFKRSFYENAATDPLSSPAVCAQRSWCKADLNADATENIFCWLIKLGVLRREVDGQGLTHRVRLTPMGKQVLLMWPGEIPSATKLRRLRHWLRRHWPRP